MHVGLESPDSVSESNNCPLPQLPPHHTITPTTKCYQIFYYILMLSNIIHQQWIFRSIVYLNFYCFVLRITIIIVWVPINIWYSFRLSVSIWSMSVVEAKIHWMGLSPNFKKYQRYLTSYWFIITTVCCYVPQKLFILNGS